MVKISKNKQTMSFSRKSKAFLKYILPYPKKLFNYAGIKISVKLKNPKNKFYPPTLGMELTNKCNLSCPLCVRARDKLNRPVGVMSFKNYKTVIDSLSDYLIHVRLHAWGEPFLNPDLVKMVHYAHYKGIYTNFHTNGHFLTEKKINGLIDAGLDEITIALDGMSQKTYEKYRQGGDFQIVRDGVKNFCEIKKQRKANNPYINLQFIVMSHNEHEIEKMKKFAEEINVDRLIIKTVNGFLVEDKYAKEFIPKKTSNSRYLVSGDKLKFKDENPCNYIFMENKINWDGTVSLCSHDVTHGGYVGGNFFKDNIKDVIFGEEFIEARRKSLTKSFEMCKKCEGRVSSI